MPDYPVGPSRSPHYEENLEWFARTRETAKTVPCPHCHAPIGDPCMNQGQPLKNFPAHTVRSEAAKRRSA